MDRAPKQGHNRDGSTNVVNKEAGYEECSTRHRWDASFLFILDFHCLRYTRSKSFYLPFLRFKKCHHCSRAWKTKKTGRSVNWSFPPKLCLPWKSSSKNLPRLCRGHSGDPHLGPRYLHNLIKTLLFVANCARLVGTPHFADS